MNELDYSKKFNRLAISVILLLLAGIGSNIIIDYNQGKDISTNTQKITGILDSGAEFIARRVTSIEIEKSEARTEKKLNRKVEKTSFDLLVEDIKYIRTKIDEKEN